MAFDEFLFGKISGYFRRDKERKLSEAGRTVFLDDIKEGLTIIARAVSGQAIEIFHAEREGGCRNVSFFLPSSMSLFESKERQRQFYLFRVLYLSVQQKLGINYSSQDEHSLKESQLRAKEASTIILEELFFEYPKLKSWHSCFLDTIMECHSGNHEVDDTWLYGKWMLNSRTENSNSKLENLSEKEIREQALKDATVMKVRAVEEVISIEVDRKQQEDYVLTHNFEKVDTADEFNGNWRDFDGEDDLKNHEEALKELRMKYTVRVDDTAHSVYQADFIENISISESAGVPDNDFYWNYDEWDSSSNRYKKNFCRVYPFRLQKKDIEYYKRTIEQNALILTGLRKMLASVNNKMQQLRRQSQGDEFDIDAITDLYVDVHSGHTPSENVYLSKRKREKDLSILLLLDVSLSSDGYANGNRIIDTEKQVSILFGEILQEFNVDFAINCFNSKTRNFLSYQTLKDFDDDWNLKKHLIGAIEPDGYTRIGGALRHSGVLLGRRQTKNKWIILISDGKPNDYDKYEGKYGVNDVKQALHELKALEINAYALAIEANAKFYLPQMFGQNHYQILTTPNELIQSLVTLYEKLKLS